MTGEEEEDGTGVVLWSIWDGIVKDFYGNFQNISAEIVAFGNMIFSFAKIIISISFSYGER
jgi:hypothetical protein